ncbi:MAG: hypothetical protein IJC18_00145, partial [Clostridia bacterium]|nr:hypothetical protein [Clostridia bacterium]
RDILVDREGFVTWDYQAFKYAAGIHEQSGGIIVTATNGVDAGYAFCRKSEDGVAHVTEFIAHSGFSAEVIRNMLDVCDSERYEFRVPVFDEFFSPFGEVNDYGMIAAVNGRTPINLLTLKGTHLPYLGLALD